MEPTQNPPIWQRTEIWIGIVIIIIAAFAFIIGNHHKGSSATNSDLGTSTEVTNMVTSDSEVGFDIKNRTYKLGTTEVTLTNGMMGTASTTRPSTVLLEGTAFGYLNADAYKDAVVIIRDEPEAGFDTNYYLVALLGNGTDATMSNSVFLGNTIRIKEIDLLPNAVEVSILDRAPGEGPAIAPTIPRTLLFKLSGSTLTPFTN